jgi:hypothetical protein
MSSIRKKLTVNENDSKNTRMDLASAGVLGNWRPFSGLPKLLNIWVESLYPRG